MRKLLLAFALLFALPLFAQTSAPSLPGYSVSIAAGYTSTTGNQTNNGFFSSVAIPIYNFNGSFLSKYDANLALRGDYFTIATPSTYVLTGGPELRFQFSKPTLLSGTVFQPFTNLGLGAARSQCVSTESCPAGADQSAHFAFKIGGGLDLPINSTLVARIFEIDYIRSTIFPTGNVTVSNFAQISAGLSIHF